MGCQSLLSNKGHAIKLIHWKEGEVSWRKSLTFVDRSKWGTLHTVPQSVSSKASQLQHQSSYIAVTAAGSSLERWLWVFRVLLQDSQRRLGGLGPLSIQGLHDIGCKEVLVHQACACEYEPGLQQRPENPSLGWNLKYACRNPLL